LYDSSQILELPMFFISTILISLRVPTVANKKGIPPAISEALPHPYQTVIAIS